MGMVTIRTQEEVWRRNSSSGDISERKSKFVECHNRYLSDGLLWLKDKLIISNVMTSKSWKIAMKGVRRFSGHVKKRKPSDIVRMGTISVHLSGSKRFTCLNYWTSVCILFFAGAQLPLITRQWREQKREGSPCRVPWYLALGSAVGKEACWPDEAWNLMPKSKNCEDEHFLTIWR